MISCSAREWPLWRILRKKATAHERKPLPRRSRQSRRSAAIRADEWLECWRHFVRHEPWDCPRRRRPAACRPACVLLNFRFVRDWGTFRRPRRTTTRLLYKPGPIQPHRKHRILKIKTWFRSSPLPERCAKRNKVQDRMDATFEQAARLPERAFNLLTTTSATSTVREASKSLPSDAEYVDRSHRVRR